MPFLLFLRTIDFTAKGNALSPPAPLFRCNAEKVTPSRLFTGCVAR